MTSLLRRSLSGTRNSAYMVRYLTVGAIAVAIDIGLFATLLRLHVLLPVTTTIAFLTSTVAHYTLNKLWTFRVPGKPHAYQLTAYVTILVLSLALTQIVIESLVLGAHVAPLLAKGVALVVQLPFSFFGHRYFTFREGRLQSTDR